MTRTDIQNEIERRKKLCERRKAEAIRAIGEDSINLATLALVEVAAHMEVIEEYQFRLEEMEVNGDD